MSAGGAGAEAEWERLALRSLAMADETAATTLQRLLTRSTRYTR